MCVPCVHAGHWNAIPFHIDMIIASLRIEADGFIRSKRGYVFISSLSIFFFNILRGEINRKLFTSVLKDKEEMGIRNK